MKWSVNEAKLTGLWASKGATIQQVLILKFAFGPEKLPCLWRNARQQLPCRFYRGEISSTFEGTW